MRELVEVMKGSDMSVTMVADNDHPHCREGDQGK
jgi:hypothetical protein